LNNKKQEKTTRLSIVSPPPFFFFVKFGKKKKVMKKTKVRHLNLKTLRCNYHLVLKILGFCEFEFVWEPFETYVFEKEEGNFLDLFGVFGLGVGRRAIFLFRNCKFVVRDCALKEIQMPKCFRTLYIIDCPEFEGKTVQPNMEHYEIWYCPKFVGKVVQPNTTRYEVNNCPKFEGKTIQPNMERYEVWSCPEFEGITVQPNLKFYNPVGCLNYKGTAVHPKIIVNWSKYIDL